MKVRSSAACSGSEAIETGLQFTRHLTRYNLSNMKNTSTNYYEKIKVSS